LKRRSENQICREHSRASFTAPVRLSRKMDACLKPVGISITDGWIEPARGCNERVPGAAGTPSAAASEFCTWQHARSPAEEETGQFVPQQGASIAATPACAIPQPRPACNASTSAINTRIPFFTKINLILCAATGNNEAREASSGALLEGHRDPGRTDPVEVSGCSPLRHLLPI
jgi:hypothetical protein